MAVSLAQIFCAQKLLLRALSQRHQLLRPCTLQRLTTHVAELETALANRINEHWMGQIRRELICRLL